MAKLGAPNWERSASSPNRELEPQREQAIKCVLSVVMGAVVTLLALGGKSAAAGAILFAFAGLLRVARGLAS